MTLNCDAQRVQVQITLPSSESALDREKRDNIYCKCEDSCTDVVNEVKGIMEAMER